MPRALSTVLLLGVVLVAQEAASTSVNPVQRQAWAALPADALASVRFAGLAQASSAASTLDLVQLALTPVVRESLAPLEAEWEESLLDVDPQADFLWAAARPLVSVPMTIAITGVDVLWVEGRARPIPEMLFVAEAGSEAQAFAGTLHMILGQLEKRFTLRSDIERYRETDISVVRVNGGGTRFEVASATRDGLVIVSMHASSVREMLDRLADPAAPSLRGQVPPLQTGDAEVLRLILAPGFLGSSLAKVLPRDVLSALRTLGVSGQSRLELSAFVRAGRGITHCLLSGLSASGLAGTCPKEPVQERLLNAVPDTAVMVAASRHDLSAVLRTLEAAARELLPGDIVDTALRQLSVGARAAGVDILKDISPLIGNECVAYFELTRSANVPNVVLLCQGANGALLQTEIKKIQLPAGVELRERDLDGFHVVQLIPPKPAPLPEGQSEKSFTAGSLHITETLIRGLVRPALAVKDDLAIFALNERGLAAAMARLAKNDKPYLSNELIRRDLGLALGTRPLAFAHVDTRRLVDVAAKLGLGGESDGLLAISTKPELNAKLPGLGVVFAQTDRGPLLEFSGIETATLLCTVSRILMESEGVPPAAVPRFLLRLRDPSPR